MLKPVPAAVQALERHNGRVQPAASVAASDVFPAPDRPSMATTRVAPALGAARRSARTIRLTPSLTLSRPHH